MAIILIILALLPVAYGVFVTGDFTQYVYKPSHRQVQFVLKNRTYLIGASVLLWSAGLAWHLLYDPINSLFLIISGFLVIMFTIGGFLMPGYIMFRAINRPTWRSASEADADLSVDDSVIGLEINGDARAFPIDFILRAHMANETIGGEDVTLSYCMLSNTAMAFKPELNGQKMRFITPMQWENNMMLYDAASGHLSQQIIGRDLNNPDADHTLSSFPTRIMPWAAWRKLHPDTKVMYHPPQTLFDRLIRGMLRSQFYVPNFKQEKPMFPTISEFDSRLPTKSEVLGVCVQDVCKAYPLTHLQQQPVINDNLNGAPLLIAYDSEQDVADVFDRQHDGKTLTFRHETGSDGSFLLVDEETNSKWNMTGQAISGTLEGSQLKAVTHYNRVLWFSWSNFYPETEIAS